MKMTQLQIASAYSLMNSTIHIDKLIERAKNLNYQSIALTDKGVMHAAVQFYQKCIAAGLKPIIGVILPVTIRERSVSMTFLAKNISGYQTLMKWSSIYQKNHLPLELDVLKKNHTHIFMILPLSELVLKGDEIDQIHQTVPIFEELTCFGNFRIGIEGKHLQHVEPLKALCQEQDIIPVAISEIRYLEPADRQAYQALRAIDEKVVWSENDFESYDGMFLPTIDEMNNRFYSWVECLEESNKVAELCDISIELNHYHLPKYPLPENEKGSTFLRTLCKDQLPKKYQEITETIVSRLDYELSVIKDMGFSDYFLIVWDFITYAKQNGIMVGPGRGSAAGSLVSYLLGITNVDPIKYELLFERFLNPDRVSMPDIDIDFSDDKRDHVIKYVQEKYGEQYVAQIITFGTFAKRSIIRELIKVMHVNEDDSKYLLSMLGKSKENNIIGMVKGSKELTEYIKQSPKLQLLFRVATKLEGLPRHTSTHAAGVIISEKPLNDYTPTMPSQHGIDLTQFAMKELEDIGLLKMDFLGLRNLSLLERIINQIHRGTNKSFALESINFQDEKTYALLRNGNTSGIFQLESRGMQQVLVDLKPTTFEDVVAVNALYRPGPMDFIPVYIARKHGKEKVDYPHQDLKPILEKTYGVLVYQEQIMQIANKLANFSYGEADSLRRAVSKKEKEILLTYKEKFIKGCLDNKYTEAVSEEIFEWIVRFSNYGFNRSHAVAYSMISYQLAYLKANFPASFYTELLNMVIGQTDKIEQYIKEAKSTGITVSPPSINDSLGRFRMKNTNIIVGLTAIKGIGYNVVQEIMLARKKEPFVNLFDFCMRVSSAVINRSVIELLVLAGAFDQLNKNRASLLASIDQALEQADLFGDFKDQTTLFDNNLNIEHSYTEAAPFPAIKQLMLEKEVLGFYLTSHPLKEHRKELRENGYMKLDQLHHELKEKKGAAVVQSIRMIRTKRGESMAFIVLADEEKEIEAVLFPSLFRNVHHWLKEEEMVIFEGKLEKRNEKDQVIVENIIKLSQRSFKPTDKSVYIKVTDNKERNALEFLRSHAASYPGETPVYAYFQEKKKLYKLTEDYNINRSSKSLPLLKNRFGAKNIVLQENKE